MKLKNILILLFTLTVHQELRAEQITIPNIFTAGTKAVAEEVNENFSTLATESNAQNARIQALETARISDQLVCIVTNYYWVTNGQPSNCVQTSDPTNTKTLTYVEVVNAGWWSVSVGNNTHVFSK